MQTYIITMDMENELSEAAAGALNGHFFTCPQNYQAIWDQVSDYLSDKGFPRGRVFRAKLPFGKLAVQRP